MKKIGNYFGKEFSEVEICDLNNLPNDIALILDSKVDTDFSKITEALKKGVANWYIFGEKAGELNTLLDNEARKINCDVVPEWFWSKSMEYAINAAIKGAENSLGVVADNNTRAEIVKYLESIRGKKLEDIATIGDAADTSAPSRFNL